MSNKLISKIINEVSLDPRVKDGVFDIENNDHMEALREYLYSKGIDKEVVREFSNSILEKSKTPSHVLKQRQAFNKDGIKVTFPTPEYKAAAIRRGTHFEEDPTKQRSNLFAPPTPEPVQKAITPAPSEPKTNLPISQAPDTTEAEPEKGKEAQPVQAKTTAAPQQTPTSAEPTAEPTELPLPPIKPPAEKEADKKAIKTMLKGDDYMLERVKNMLKASDYMLERVIENAFRDENLHSDIMAECQCRNPDGTIIRDK